MSYENEAFDSDTSLNRGGDSDSDKRHLLKLSIDFLTVKDMRVSASLSVAYSLRLL